MIIDDQEDNGWQQSAQCKVIMTRTHDTEQDS